MSTAIVRVYAELNDVLPADLRMVPFDHRLIGKQSVGEIAESLGIPLAKVDLALVNGETVSPAHPVNDGDRVSIYPVFESFDIKSLTRIRTEPLRQPRFVLDVHLGKLSHHLRLFGFDTLYENNYTDSRLLDISISECRILLSRDRDLIGHPDLTHGYLVAERHPPQQLVEVIHRFDLFRIIAPFRRCLRCNVLLRSVEKEKVTDRLPARVRDGYDEFTECPVCSRVYWKGSHHARMQAFVTRVIEFCQQQSTPEGTHAQP